jgi:hypothetical protein
MKLIIHVPLGHHGLKFFFEGDGPNFPGLIPFKVQIIIQFHKIIFFSKRQASFLKFLISQLLRSSAIHCNATASDHIFVFSRDFVLEPKPIGFAGATHIFNQGIFGVLEFPGPEVITAQFG